MFQSGHLRVAVAALLLLLGGCTGKHVTFFPENVAPDPPGETRIFLDARGHLYPETGLADDYKLHEKHKGSLFEAAYDRQSDLCGSAAAGTEMAMLCTAISADNCAAWSACVGEWENVQKALWQARGQEIASASAREGETMLVFLVHGFNNWYTESQPNYDKAEAALKSLAPPGQKIRFVEIYWDGCRGLDIGVGCWGRAQFTGPLVGFSLRQLFNAIDDNWTAATPRPQMRLLTHSSGAFVAGAIVGSPIAALPRLKNPKGNARYELFRAHRSDMSGPYRVPQSSDLKIAMLAAATPYTTFSGTPDFPGGAMVKSLDLLISVHPKDSAITKKGLVSCRMFGASCLGARREDVCKLKRILEASGRRMSVTGYDFARGKSWGNRAGLHAFSVYIEQAFQHSTFLRDFMALKSPVDIAGQEGQPIACP